MSDEVERGSTNILQEERNTTHFDNEADPASAISDMRSRLLSLGEEQAALLLRISGSYVQKMGLATGSEAQPVAQEVMQESIVEALEHSNLFDPDRQLTMWLLGIALNIIRHKKAQKLRHQQREFSFDQLSRLYAEPMSENDLLDQIAPSPQLSPEQVVESDEQIHDLLALVSPEDQQILRLAFLEDVTRDALAQQLGLTAGAARVRLHRALARLRAAWIAQQEKTQKGEAHE
jgi:RNA polymerase sigma factor (sigma-70 family)